MVDFMENPIKMDDLGVPLFLETPISTTNGGCSIVVLEYQSAINSVELFPIPK